MKRSKLFLGVTGCLLAIVGVAASKAAKVGAIPVFYTLNGACTPYTPSQLYTISNTAHTVNILGGNYTLQTQGPVPSKACGQFVEFDPQ